MTYENPRTGTSERTTPVLQTNEGWGDLTTLRVYLVTPAFPPELGGQEQHLHALAEALIAQGAQVSVFTRRLQKDFAPREQVGSVPVVRFSPIGESRGKGWKAVFPLLLLLGKITYRLIRDARRYDVVLVSGFNITPFAAIVASFFTRKPVVVRPESPLELSNGIGPESREKMGLSQDSMAVRLYHALRRGAARRVDRYIAISAQIRRQLLDTGIAPGAITAIPNGIDASRFSPVTPAEKAKLRAALGLPVHQRLLIYTGRMAHSKGVLTLVDIWRELAPAHPDTHLVMVGSGLGSTDDCENELREFVCDTQLTDRVTFAGNVANVPEYLQASDIFVFPSDAEGFGLSIIEAMAVGLPGVSTRVGVAADLAPELQGSLLVVPPQDHTAFKEALETLLSDHALEASMASRTREAVEANYSMQVVAQRHLAVLELLANPAARAADARQQQNLWQLRLEEAAGSGVEHEPSAERDERKQGTGANGV